MAASLKDQGNALTKAGDYEGAIEKYSTALSRLPSSDNPTTTTLLLNRSHACLQLTQYDFALSDALAANVLHCRITNASKPPEKGLFRASRALYELRRFEECMQHLQLLLDDYSQNAVGKADMERCRLRLREQGGDYDWKGMLEEAVAKVPMPDMDRGTFVGPIEVRDCEFGKGLFVTKDVEAGDLLLCEKSFAAVFAGSLDIGQEQKEATDTTSDPKAGKKAMAKTNTPQNPDAEKEAQEKASAMELRLELSTETMFKLHSNPSWIPEFSKLYAGPDAQTPHDPQTNLPILDEDFVDNRITYNAFGFPVLNHIYHYSISHTPELVEDSTSASRGVWLQASYVNHSCYPTVRRSFIGDMIIFRAQANIPANSELKFGYISGLEELEERQAKLRNYGFECNCQICYAEKNTSEAQMKERRILTALLHTHFTSPTPQPLQTYLPLLARLSKTYSFPPTTQYQRTLISPLTNLITGCLASQLPDYAITLVHQLLTGLGFIYTTSITTAGYDTNLIGSAGAAAAAAKSRNISNNGKGKCEASGFRILQWGFLVDEIVGTLVELGDAYGMLGRRGEERGAVREAKRAYLIMCGEEASWEGAYGRGRGEGGKGRGSAKDEEAAGQSVEGN